MLEKAEVKFRTYLSSQNLKYTPERRRIFEAVFNTETHFAADELYLRLKNRKQRVSRATVYRTLDLLVKLGFLRKLHLGIRSSVYENVKVWRRHGHLVCLSCGKIQEFGLEEIEETVLEICKRYDFETQERGVQISGYCQKCKESKTTNHRVARK